MRVVVFTADENNGGIMQFTYQMLSTFLELACDTKAFIPDLSHIVVPDELSQSVVRYTKVKDPTGFHPDIARIAQHIQELDPDIVYTSDDAILTTQVLRLLDKRITKIVTFHDVIPHIAKLSLKRRLVYWLNMFYRYICLGVVNKVVVLSENSKKKFETRYRRYVSKLELLRLGAHPPKKSELERPKEIPEDIKGFFLFFGRIEKYKGVSDLINAYDAQAGSTELLPLVIAGNGIIDEQDRRIINRNSRIHCVNRYISDAEMNWLFKHCCAVTAPYIEASQSGVIPIAYHFGKPVIATNIPGLQEYVDNGRTGFLYDSSDELQSILCDWFSMNNESFKLNCLTYCSTQLNWKENVRKLLCSNRPNCS